MKKSLLLVVIPALLIVGCRGGRGTTNTSIPESSSSNVSNGEVSSSQEASNTSATSQTSATSATSKTSNTSSSKTSTTSTTKTDIDGGEREGEWFEAHTYLSDIGFYSMGAPKNETPISLRTTLGADSESWSNNDFTESELGDFRYIYKNSCDDGESSHKTSASFYDNTAGGLKFTNPGTGFGSPLFEHTGAKLEIRIGISQVNNGSDEFHSGDTGYVFFFDKDDNLLGKYTIEQGRITSSTQQIKFYYTESNAPQVAYFEFRLKNMPFVGSQSYNIGIGYCNFKSWERV